LPKNEIHGLSQLQNCLIQGSLASFYSAFLACQTFPGYIITAMKIKTHIILTALFAMVASDLQALPAASGGNAASDKKSSITSLNKDVDNKTSDKSAVNSDIKSRDASFKDSNVDNMNKGVGNTSSKGAKINSGINAGGVEITNGQLILNSGIFVDSKALKDSKIKYGIEAETTELKENRITNTNSQVKSIALDGSKTKSGLISKSTKMDQSAISNKNRDVKNTAAKKSTANSGINLGGQE
jgi:hypothetical protein